MNRSLAILSALALVTFAGCAAPPSQEEEASTSGDALSSVSDEQAVVPATDDAKPKVEAVDLSTIKFDLKDFQDSRGNLDYPRLKIDVLDTGFDDHDYRTHSSDLRWVESNHRELPAIVDKLAHGVDVGGGGKCRIQNLSLKKIVVGCKWTW